MKSIMIALFILVVVFNGIAQTPRITVHVPYEKKRNRDVEKAILAAYDINSTEDSTTRYYYNYVDLNGDGINEVLVYLFAGKFCGTGGCDGALLRKTNGRYKLINYFEPVRNPIFISTKKTKGWRDVIFFNSGGGINPGYYSVSRFNGRSHPDNPTIKKDAPPLRIETAVSAYLVGKGYGDTGLRFNFK
jgi:hypothetical protein